MPIGTALFASTCIGVFLLQSAFQLNTGALAIGAFPVVFLGQWYRIVTSAFLHGGIFHIGMNMMSLLTMGPSTESILGSVMFVLLVVATILLEGLLYLAMSLAGWGITGDASWLHIYAVGFSGVLFTLAVEEASLSPAPTRSVFGLFSVPTRLYPWVLLLIMQFALPNISFFGHLSGLLVGILHVGQMLRCILPSNETARKLGSQPFLRAIASSPMFVAAPTNDPIQAAAVRAGASGSCFGTVSLAFAALWEGIGPIVQWLYSGLRGILFAIGLGPCVGWCEGAVVAALSAAFRCCTCGRGPATNNAAEPGEAREEQGARDGRLVPLPSHTLPEAGDGGVFGDEETGLPTGVAAADPTGGDLAASAQEDDSAALLTGTSAAASGNEAGEPPRSWGRGKLGGSAAKDARAARIERYEAAQAARNAHRKQ